MIANLSLFSGRLFCGDRGHASFDALEVRGAEIIKAGDEAEILLRAVLPDGGALLCPSAWKDLRGGLAKFLEDVLLLHPDQDYLQGLVRTWVETQQEMLSRLQSDREALAVWASSECGSITAIETDLSDRHNGGRTVAIFTFASGMKIVYKPREMGIEDWYCRFASWLNQSGVPFPIRAARVLTRAGYGWMEFIAHRPCESNEGLSLYYRNAGALLCALHVLCARDCHFQNLIACGDNPVLVDAEMLFQAQLTERESTAVTQTGMIPNFRFGPEGQHYDVSGLGFVEPKTTHFRVPEWSAAGVSYRMGVLEPRLNVPFSKTQAARPGDFVGEVIDGFSQTYRFLLGRRFGVLEWIRSAAALPVRYLVRETMEYYQALQLDLSRDGNAVELLPPLAPNRRVFSGLRQDEIAALERLDIPRFVLAAAERSLCGLENCFYRSGIELALHRVEEMSEQDLAKQIQHIHLSWSLLRISGALK